MTTDQMSDTLRMRTKKEALDAVINEFNLDVNDPFTRVIANAFALHKMLEEAQAALTRAEAKLHLAAETEVSEQGKMMSDTPRTDAVQGGLEFATELPEDWEKCFQWMAGHARSLERENAELSDQVMRWFKAASPYATPGSLEAALRRFHHWEEEIVRLLGIDPKDAGSLPDDVRSRKTDSGHPHRE